jgi:hypothetical protein
MKKTGGNKDLFFYYGIGPEISYHWNRTTDKSINTDSDGNITFGSDEYSNKSLGIGPLAVAGVSCHLAGRVGLSAEFGLSALYQWASQTQSQRSTYAYTSSPTRSSGSGSISSWHGWNFSLNNISIGVIIGL